MSTLTIGQTAPGFSLPMALPGGGEGVVSPSDCIGKWVVLYFYPKDSSPGCTTQAQEFSALAGRFQAAGAVVVGVSKDSMKSHHGFMAKKELAVPLASDPGTQVLEAYGAWGEKKNCGKTCVGTIRSTVLIDPAGRVARHWPSAKSKGHAAEVLAALEQLAGC